MAKPQGQAQHQQLCPSLVCQRARLQELTTSSHFTWTDESNNIHQSATATLAFMRQASPATCARVTCKCTCTHPSSNFQHSTTATTAGYQRMKRLHAPAAQHKAPMPQFDASCKHAAVARKLALQALCQSCTAKYKQSTSTAQVEPRNPANPVLS